VCLCVSISAVCMMIVAMCSSPLRACPSASVHAAVCRIHSVRPPCAYYYYTDRMVCSHLCMQLSHMHTRACIEEASFRRISIVLRSCGWGTDFIAHQECIDITLSKRRGRTRFPELLSRVKKLMVCAALML